MESKARRRRVPAFGEWNYYYYSGELATPAAAASEPHWHAAAAAPELDASSDVWFKYSPPLRKPPRPSAGRKKVHRPEKADDRSSYGGGGGKRGVRHHGAATPARASSSDGVVPSSVERTPAGKAKTTGAGAAGVRRVVRPVDADLYQVPPPEFVPDYDDEPRRWHNEKRTKKKASRILWMGCFGFNCVPAE